MKLFIVAKLWEQPKCPPPDEWINIVVHPSNGMLLSHKGKNGCVNMDDSLKYIMPSKRSQTQKLHALDSFNIKHP